MLNEKCCYCRLYLGPHATRKESFCENIGGQVYFNRKWYDRMGIVNWIIAWIGYFAGPQSLYGQMNWVNPSNKKFRNFVKDVGWQKEKVSFVSDIFFSFNLPTMIIFYSFFIIIIIYYPMYSITHNYIICISSTIQHPIHEMEAKALRSRKILFVGASNRKHRKEWWTSKKKNVTMKTTHMQHLEGNRVRWTIYPLSITDKRRQNYRESREPIWRYFVILGNFV